MTNANGNGTTVEASRGAAMVRVEADAPITPRTMNELTALAASAAKSNFYGAKTPEQALMILMSGRDLGLSYTQALRAFHVIEGRPGLSADGAVAVCLARKDICEYFRVVEATDTHATVETKRTGNPARSFTFRIEEAKRAGLIKPNSNWEKWPSRMCVARAKLFLAREEYADLLMGLYDPDEIRETSERPEVTVRHATPVAATPHDPVTGEVLEGEVVPTQSPADALVQAIHGAADSEALKAVGASIASANVSAAEKKTLRAEYAARDKALKDAEAKAAEA